MKRWTVAVAAVALSVTSVAACGSDDDEVDVPGVSTPIDETIDSAVDTMVDSMVDSVTDTEIETDDTDASTETTVVTTRPPTAGGSPGTTTVGAATSNP